MPGFSDKLATLRHVNKGLLARLHYMDECRRSAGARLQSLTNPKYERARKALERAFPEIASTTDRSVEELDADVHTIQEELRESYLTYVDVLRFNEVAPKFLCEVATNVGALSFERSPDLVASVLDLLVGFIKLHLLLARDDQRRIIVAMYAYAHAKAAGAPEQSFRMLAGYVMELDSPFRRVQHELRTVSQVLGGWLAAFAPVVRKVGDMVQLQQNPAFSASRDTAPSNEAVLRLLPYLEHVREWVIFGVMGCPEEAAQADIQFLLRWAMEDVLLLPVYRDDLMLVHFELDRALAALAPRAKPKKLMTDAERTALDSAPRKHRAVRSFVRRALSELCVSLEGDAGLAAPKLQLALALLSMARSELLWYHAHADVPARVAAAKSSLAAALGPQWRDEAYTDAHVPELLHLMLRVTDIVRGCSSDISRYYLAYLQRTHKRAVQPDIDTLMAGGRLSHAVAEDVRAIPEQLARAAEPAAVREVRTRWLQVVEAMSMGERSCVMAGSGQREAAATAAVLDSLSLRMSIVCAHCRHVDELEEELLEVASPHSLWWFRDTLDKSLAQCVTQPGPARFAMAFALALGVAGRNLHVFCPEQQSVLGVQAAAASERAVVRVAEAAAAQLGPVEEQLAQLERQAAPAMVADRRNRVLGAKGRVTDEEVDLDAPGSQLGSTGSGVAAGAAGGAAGGGAAASGRSARGSDADGAAEGGALGQPGNESVPSQAGALQGLEAAWTRLTNLCHALREHSTVQAHATQLAPGEYLRELVGDYLRLYLEQAAKEFGEPDFRPSVAVRGLHRRLVVLLHIDCIIPLDLSTLVRRLLLEQAVTTSRGAAGPPSLAQRAATWFAEFVDREGCTSGGAVFDPRARAFLRVPGAPARGVDPVWLTDETELQALAVLLGPEGMGVVQQALLAVVLERVKQIKVLLQRNVDSLQAFRGQIQEPRSWLSAARDIRQLDALGEHALAVGVVLTLRSLLRDALHSVAAADAPLVTSLLERAASATPATHDLLGGEASGRGREVDVHRRSVHALAADYAVPASGVVDQPLATALMPLRDITLGKHTSTWMLLPVALAAALSSDGWRRCDLLPGARALRNNGHTLGRTAVALLSVLAPDVPQAGDDTEAAAAPDSAAVAAALSKVGALPTPECVRHWLLEFLRHASAVVLHFKTEDAVRDLPVGAMFTVLEETVAATPLLTASDLTALLPPSLVRFALVDAALGKQRSGEAARGVEALPSAAHA